MKNTQHLITPFLHEDGTVIDYQNRLQQVTVTEMIGWLQSIPPTVTALDLSNNQLDRLGELSKSELTSIFTAIPKNVRAIDLSHNNLGELSKDKLVKVLSVIPAHIGKINLEANNLFSGKVTTVRNDLLQSLPGDKRRYYLSGNGESMLSSIVLPKYHPRCNQMEVKSECSEARFSGLSSTIFTSSRARTRPTSSAIQDVEMVDIRKNKPRNANSQQLVAIKSAAQMAVFQYTDWFKGNLKVRGANGLFTRLRHGKQGQARATIFLTNLEAHEKLDTAIKFINDFLKNPKTPNHCHSFASFLLDQLTQIKDTPWEKITPTLKTNRYNLKMI
ncbi:hypothetical protein [Legionella adelaidensis]|nr:hypothetical protein [Legionella adelaidensis]